MQVSINGKSLELLEGDITTMATDAIVNAANSALVLGAGVAGAIRSRGGPDIQAECQRIGRCPVGAAVITTGGKLPARYVIHAVGPRMGEGDEAVKLRSATESSLEVAAKNRLASIALPAISTGIFGFPLERCAEIMLAATAAFLRKPSSLQRVVFCLFGRPAYQIFAATLEAMTRQPPATHTD